MRHRPRGSRRDHPDLAALSEKIESRLRGIAEHISVSSHEIILSEGVQTTHFDFIRSGSVRISKKLPDGRRHILQFAYAGSILDLDASGIAPFTAEAMTAVEAWRVPLCRLHDDVARGDMRGLLLDMTMLRLADAQEKMLLLGRKTAEERIASFLLWQMEQALPRAESTPRIRLPMARTDIADFLGLSVETVCRALHKLSVRRIIQVPNVHEIIIFEPLLLETLSARV